MISVAGPVAYAAVFICLETEVGGNCPPPLSPMSHLLRDPLVFAVFSRGCLMRKVAGGAVDAADPRSRKEGWEDRQPARSTCLRW
jgi:hypothetical protein